jgi:mediator of RNA polymerase II transcription subunit 12
VELHGGNLKMSKQRNRNSLLTTLSRNTYSNNVKDELMAIKYEMNKPQEGLYPLNDSEILGNGSKGVETYPDYQPWADSSGPGTGSGDGKDDKMNSSYLSKGYFESPAVSNEYYSARNMVQATMFSSADNCSAVLNELSQHLANAYKTRNEVINKVKYESNNFRIPPRVTLTASKKEAWLRDLANPNFPLLKMEKRYRMVSEIKFL